MAETVPTYWVIDLGDSSFHTTPEWKDRILAWLDRGLSENTRIYLAQDVLGFKIWMTRDKFVCAYEVTEESVYAHEVRNAAIRQRIKDAAEQASESDGWVDPD